MKLILINALLIGLAHACQFLAASIISQYGAAPDFHQA